MDRAHALSLYMHHINYFFMDVYVALLNQLLNTQLIQFTYRLVNRPFFWRFNCCVAAADAFTRHRSVTVKKQWFVCELRFTYD